MGRHRIYVVLDSYYLIFILRYGLIFTFKFQRSLEDRFVSFVTFPLFRVTPSDFLSLLVGFLHSLPTVSSILCTSDRRLLIL